MTLEMPAAIQSWWNGLTPRLQWRLHGSFNMAAGWVLCRAFDGEFKHAIMDAIVIPPLILLTFRWTK